MILLFTSVIFFLTGRPLFAAEVIQVWPKKNRIEISTDDGRKWANQDRVCLSRNGKKLGCGRVIEMKEEKKSAIVEIDTPALDVSKKTVRDSPSFTYLELVFGNAKIKKGDEVEWLGGGDTPREPATAIEDIPIQNIEPETKKNGDVLTEGSGKDDLLMTADGIGEKKKDSPKVEKASREPQSEENNVPVMDTRISPEKPDEKAPLSDLIVGLNYIFPNLQYQQGLSNHLTTGLTAIYLGTPVGTGDLKAGGGLITLNYYSEKLFSGNWIQLGAGYYGVTLSSSNGKSDSFRTPVGMALVGWRFTWENCINFGFAVGAQYLFQAKTANVDVGFSGLFPSISLDFGVAF
jgi:hypothetical protein